MLKIYTYPLVRNGKNIGPNDIAGIIVIKVNLVFYHQY